MKYFANKHVWVGILGTLGVALFVMLILSSKGTDQELLPITGGEVGDKQPSINVGTSPVFDKEITENKKGKDVSNQNSKSQAQDDETLPKDHNGTPEAQLDQGDSSLSEAMGESLVTTPKNDTRTQIEKQREIEQRAEGQSESVTCIDTDGDGWGWTRDKRELCEAT